MMGGLFVLFAIELFLLGVTLWWFLVNRHSYSGQTSSVTDFGWGLLAIAAAAWGTWFLVLSRRAGARRNLGDFRNLLMIVVGSGAVLLGILVINIADVLTAKPILMDVRSQFSAPASTSAEAPSAPVGDAQNGKKWFGMSCVTCHGPTGEGVANAAPSLRESDFLKTADDAAVASLIRNGRAANDPANKTGKVMPAKGGNPFLDESKIADLVAFLKDLDAQLGTSAQAAGTSADLTKLSDVAAQPAPKVVQEWTMKDFESLEISPSESSIGLGMQAFVKATCNKCHMAAVAGRELGPTLDQIVKKYPRDQLLKHIVEPSDEINEKFLAHKFLLMDGRKITGVVVSETDEQVQLMMDLLKPDQLVSILVDDIDERSKAKISAMPTGLLNVLTKEEVAGLVAYVDATGNQLAASNAPQLNRWVVPAAADDVAATTWTATTPPQSLTRRINLRGSERYGLAMTGLFVLATSVLALHLLWVTGVGAAIVMHRELQLSLATQLRLANQTWLFWMIGIVWLFVWFLLFFLIK